MIPTKFQIPALSYVAAGGYRVFSGRREHRRRARTTSASSLRPSAAGWVCVATQRPAVIDQVLYSPMLDGTSQGRVAGRRADVSVSSRSRRRGSTARRRACRRTLHFTLVCTLRNDIAWDASTDRQTGIDRVPSSIAAAIFLASTTADDATATRRSQSGTSYSYQVSAVNGDGVEMRIVRSDFQRRRFVAALHADRIGRHDRQRERRST